MARKDESVLNLCYCADSDKAHVHLPWMQDSLGQSVAFYPNLSATQVDVPRYASRLPVCPECYGRGYIVTEWTTVMACGQDAEKCDACNGSGRVP